jgi:hypothetical protein
MGAIPGGINMITGKTERIDDELLYDDWLMWAMIKHGVGTSFSDIPYSKGVAANAIGHIELTEINEVSGVSTAYKLTPKAQRYLDIMNKENE